MMMTLFFPSLDAYLAATLHPPEPPTTTNKIQQKNKKKKIKRVKQLANSIINSLSPTHYRINMYSNFCIGLDRLCKFQEVEARRY
jgi:hypothetical protein